MLGKLQNYFPFTSAEQIASNNSQLISVLAFKRREGEKKKKINYTLSAIATNSVFLIAKSFTTKFQDTKWIAEF